MTTATAPSITDPLGAALADVYEQARRPVGQQTFQVRNAQVAVVVDALEGCLARIASGEWSSTAEEAATLTSIVDELRQVQALTPKEAILAAKPLTERPCMLSGWYALELLLGVQQLRLRRLVEGRGVVHDIRTSQWRQLRTDRPRPHVGDRVNGQRVWRTAAEFREADVAWRREQGWDD